MTDKKIIKLIALIVMTLALSACADFSMYNQEPAPIGRSGEAARYPSQTLPQQVKTFPIEELPAHGDVELPYSQASDNSLGSQNPAVIALLDSAYQQSEAGQLDIAASKLERAVRIAPRDPEVWHALANVRYQQNKHVLAISLAKKSNLLSDGNRKLQRNNWLLMAACYDSLSNDSAALEARTHAARLF